MTEPPEIASDVQEIADGLWHWRIHNTNIGGGISSSHAVRTEHNDDGGTGCVLVDPVRLDPHALQTLPPVRAVVLTSHGHQRAAWHYRERFRVHVWAPRGAAGLEELPDHEYGSGDVLPGGLLAIHTPGPEPVHFSLLDDAHDAVIVSDLVSRGDDGALALVPAELHDDPERTRASVGQLLELDWGLLLLDHGAPVTEDAHDALESVLG